MIEVRIHGRGGQGNVVAAYLLAMAAFEEGRYSQAFPNFGAERRGAPVTAFVRIAGQPIRRRNQVQNPAFVIVQDQALLQTGGVLNGLLPDGGVLVDSILPSEELSARLGRPVVALAASTLAKEILGRPVPNTALLAAFLSLTQVMPLEALAKALRRRFKGEALERNLKLIERAYAGVPAGLWRQAKPSLPAEAGAELITGSQALEGSQALAQAAALCRPQVVSAYPITPQTHIVENIAKLVADGKLKAELVSVESEFSAASVVLGAVAAGSRAFTASSSQGILLMAEVLYNMAGMRLPAVMVCANRAVSAPLSIWNDQQDSMAVRDAGWIQLYCEDNQEAVDTLIQAYRIAERVELPVMVCVDGFVLTHTLESISLPAQEQVDGFLPPFRYERALDSAHPLSLGTLVSPDYYTEVRHAHHQAMLRSLDEIDAADADWAALSGRSYGGLLHADGPAAAKTGILAMGSALGTLREAAQTVSEPLRLIKLRAFRPFPAAALRAACAGLERLIVVDRALSPGSGGIVGAEAAAALQGMKGAPAVHNFAAGLGGRDLPLDILPCLLQAAVSQAAGGFAIVDLVPERLAEEDR